MKVDFIIDIASPNAYFCQQLIQPLKKEPEQSLTMCLVCLEES